MPLPRTILVPTDLTPPSVRVADYAVRLAETLGAAVDLLHVFAFPYDWYYWDLPELAVLRGAVEADAQAKLDALATRHARSGVPVRAHFIVRGSVASAILEAADAADAELVVMGAGGSRNTPTELGGVTEQVLRCCARPLLVAHSEAGLGAAGRAVRPHVLVPVGDPETGRVALRTALPLAAALRGQAHVVHVPPFADVGVDADAAREEPSHLRAVEEVLRATAATDTPLGISVDGGDPVEAVACTATDECADLIVLATSEWSGTRHAERLALVAPCPLLVVPVTVPSGGDGAPVVAADSSYAPSPTVP